jgi:serine/threonine-protein kinase RsbW
LTLFRETASLPVVRGLVDIALAAIAVDPDCRGEIAVALAETCSNAVRHADTTDQYEVTVEVIDGQCVVEVTDTGAGFAPDPRPSLPPEYAEAGRGLYLVAALTDDFCVIWEPDRGTVVRFEKALTYLGKP